MKNEIEKISGSELNDDDINENLKNKNDDPGEAMTVERPKRWFRNKLGICFFLFLILSAGLIGFFITSYGPSKEGQESGIVKMTKKQAKSLFEMDPFVIPYNKNTFSYISFNIVLYIPEKFLRDEMLDKKREIRDSIYESLRVSFDMSDKDPSPDLIKNVVLGEVNSNLSGGHVKESYLIQFLLM
jgi:flagellar basal body-associated protein FliL